MASVTSTYARAFADVVVGSKLDAAQVIAELRMMLANLKETPELRQVWENPSVPAEQKRGVLDAIAARQGISRPVRNFVAVLIDHRRVALVDDIVRQTEQPIHERLGFAGAGDH